MISVITTGALPIKFTAHVKIRPLFTNTNVHDKYLNCLVYLVMVKRTGYPCSEAVDVKIHLHQMMTSPGLLLTTHGLQLVISPKLFLKEKSTAHTVKHNLAHLHLNYARLA